ncbi:MAG: hypothetical protein FJ264_00475 [Planctomycetes bacterium]|nr:hypothetical protein [Planctomycetota bacterium]
MALPGCAAVTTAGNICLPLAVKAGGFARHIMKKKVVRFRDVLHETILYSFPHRQYVFSIPIMLRSILSMTGLCWQNCTGALMIDCLSSYKM